MEDGVGELIIVVQKFFSASTNSANSPYASYARDTRLYLRETVCLNLVWVPFIDHNNGGKFFFVLKWYLESYFQSPTTFGI